MLLGLAVGAIGMAWVARGGLLGSLKTPAGPQANPQAQAAPASAPGVLENTADNAPKKPQYDFYSVLSEREVRIPDAEIRAQAKAEQRQPATPAAPASPAPGAPPAVSQDITAAPASALPPPAANSGYLLQVGAFPNAADAEALKAKLALQGFVASVQPSNINGQTYHRVRLGPFTSATELETTRQRLAGAGIHAIALKADR